ARGLRLADVAAGGGALRGRAARRGLGVLAARGTGRFAAAAGADVALAFALLLRGTAGRFLVLGPGEIAPVLLRALVLRLAGFLERDRDRLLAALDLAALSTGPALQLAVLELVHDAAGGLALG